MRKMGAIESLQKQVNEQNELLKLLTANIAELVELFPERHEYTTIEAANYLGVSESMVRKYQEMGLPYEKRGRRTVFKKEHIEPLRELSGGARKKYLFTQDRK